VTESDDLPQSQSKVFPPVLFSEVDMNTCVLVVFHYSFSELKKGFDINISEFWSDSS
jgi:hypothetical protein